ncbi:hypothetical protein GJ672_00135 [Spiribacter sp. 2438]|nr:hypothetical protein GJ672_00135 [Spiribacter sp. 2438]
MGSKSWPFAPRPCNQSTVWRASSGPVSTVSSNVCAMGHAPGADGQNNASAYRSVGGPKTPTTIAILAILACRRSTMTSHGLRVLLIAVVIGLAGCGVKGDLELPATRTTGAAP